MVEMGSVTSKREQALVVQPIQTLSTDEDILEKHSKMSSNKMTADQVLEESDFEETESMSEKSILMTENEIKEMKTITFKSLEKKRLMDTLMKRDFLMKILSRQHLIWKDTVLL